MATFITGASGFVGLALAEHLLARGETVVGFDLQPPNPAAVLLFERLPGRFVFERGDVCDVTGLVDAMTRHHASRLVTLAAITAAADRERRSPASIAAVNIGGCWNAIHAAARAGVERVVHGSSGSVYGASGATEPLLKEDETPQKPEGLYGISKQAAEAGALRLGALLGLDVVVGRIGTCFGPWESDSGVRDTPSAPLQVVRRAARGEPVVLPRPGRRDWLYVRDAAAALAALLDASTLAHRVYNLAAGFEWSVAEWCSELSREFTDLTWRLAQAGAEANIDYYAPYDRAPMDTGRLRADTGFAPRYDLARAAQDFLAWRRQTVS